MNLSATAISGIKPLFGSLQTSDVSRVLESAVTEGFLPGARILQEGDRGDCMYLIAEGTVQIYTTAFDGSDLVLARLGSGDWFGEQALLPGGSSRRNASVRAVSACTLRVISRETFQQTLAHESHFLDDLRITGEAQRHEKRERLRQAFFAAADLPAAGDSYRTEQFAAGQKVFAQGDPGDGVYLILSGSAEVRRADGAAESRVAELLPGEFFGELAALHDEPRSATVLALTDLEVARFEGSWFRAACASHPALGSLMESLASIYHLPNRGVVTLQTGTFEGEPALTSVHNLDDGRKVLSVRLLHKPMFLAHLLDAPGGETVRFGVAGSSEFRELTVVDGKITAIASEGQWTSLGEMLARMLEDVPVEPWQLLLFRERGDFRAEHFQPVYEEREVMCSCKNVTLGQIQQAMRENCHSVQALAEKTGATQVCGGCVPLVQEVLGRSDWVAARIVEIVPHTADIRTFRIKPITGAVVAHRPGQYITVQARIDNKWIQRAYTISSPPSNTEAYEITVKQERGGVFSNWLFQRHEKDALLRIAAPAGDYYLPEDNTGEVVCLVAGIGVTPALAMARSLAAAVAPFPLHIDYSVSAKEQAICEAEFAELAGSFPGMSVRLRATKSDGRLNRDSVQNIVTQYAGASFYLCGSLEYLEHVQRYLAESGVAAERVHVENFFIAGEKASPAPAESAHCPVAGDAAAAALPATPAEEAEAFLKQFYSEAGAKSAFTDRWRQVKQEFDATGTYVQTSEELTFAARLAWRNSTRCIARLYWQGLTVRDLRHLTTEDEMFEAIFEHISLAGNGGNLRPVISVFAPSVPGTPGPQILSPQFFRYAGYRSPSGEVLGDPGNTELTETAIAIGWKPPATRTAFDLLPIMLQLPGKEPQWREIPKELVMEVAITHPDFEWFADLGLKWYAVPAVSGMLFDAGGVHYTAAPFNGWYMGTEIGARNFGDTQRYNLLPVIAEKMGLDTSTDRSLWRDRAIIELNIAVLSSYDRAGVKMADHHGASHGFNQFEELENKAGRVVHGRWNWLVPPISGSTVTVFHQEHWQDIELKPNYFSQAAPPREGAPVKTCPFA